MHTQLAAEDYSNAASPVRVWRWRVRSAILPVQASLAIGEAARAATTRAHVRLGFGLLPAKFHRDDAPTHCHGHWLPEDLDGDGLVDCVTVYSASGLSQSVIAALALVGQISVRGKRVELCPEAMDGEYPYAGRVWQSVTPYVTPKWRTTKTKKERPSLTAEAQLISDLRVREMPVPTRVTWTDRIDSGAESILARQFDMRRGGGKTRASPPGDAVPAFATLTFQEPVAGPLALGYGAHFGLGQFRPVF